MWTLLTQKGFMNYDKWKMSSFGHYVYKNDDPHAKVIARASFVVLCCPQACVVYQFLYQNLEIAWKSLCVCTYVVLFQMVQTKVFLLHL